MRHSRIIFLVFISCTLLIKSQAQNIDSVLYNFYKHTSFEKAYVHFDNNKYAAGQTIWYKAYLLNGFEPSLQSKNFYIDWYDDHGKLINSSITPISYAYSFGNFIVPEQYQGKYIQAVAYTKWMRNFDSSYFFKQKFPILKADNKLGQNIQYAPETTIQFLPESGNLIANKQNIIAFKAIDQDGLPATIQGTIINKAGDSITSFKSVHDGMGKFVLTPLLNEEYSAIWVGPLVPQHLSEQPDPVADIMARNHKVKIPSINQEGINLIVEAGSGNRIFHIQRTSSVPESMKKLLLVGQINGRVLFKAPINLSEKESISSTLPITKMPSGIVQLTIFDANNQPICERLIFVKNSDYLINAKVIIDSISTIKRGKNVIEVELLDSSYANFSLAITDADLNTAPENNIAAQLLLQGDLTGYINNPAYYFSSNADSISTHLDLVMLTNGWRRFSWQSILSNHLSELSFTKDSGYQTLIGKISDYTIKKSTKESTINLILAAKDSSEFLLSVPIQSDGSFYAKNVVLYDTTKVFYSLSDSKLSAKNKVTFHNDFFKIDFNKLNNEEFANSDTTGLAKFIALIDEQKKLALLKQHTTLNEVTVYSKEKSRLKQLDQKYTQGMFSGGSAAAFDMSTIQNASHTQSIFDFLTGKVPGLVIGNSMGGLASEGIVTYRGGTPSFYLNEIYIPTSQLLNIDMSEVAYVKVFSPPFAGGNSEAVATGPNISVRGQASGKSSINNAIASSSAIAIYTKKGDDVDNGKTKYNTSGMEYQFLSGYAPIKEFYTPNYAEKERASTLPDLRSTLLWDPLINLDKRDNKAVIRFYNNDITHTFRLVLEGMASKGKIIHISKILK